MPVCAKCGKMQATAEMRRSTKPGLWLCKDTQPCLERAKQLRRVMKETEKSGH